MNNEQKKAVTHGDGPLLIVAGAGTGKTTVITKRLAYLIENGFIRTDEILALTFTDKAAGEMEERIDKLLPYGYLDLWISTFHSFCQRILKEYGMEIGLSPDFKLLDETGGWILIRKHFDKFNLSHYRPLGRPTKFIKVLLKHFGRLKDEAISPEEYLAYSEKLFLNADSADFIKRSVSTNNIEDEVIGSERERIKEVAEAYHTYQQLLLNDGALDFGDLILFTLKLLDSRPVVLNRLREKFKYILVDEFQDTNWAQFELIKKLGAPKNNITVVGDDDQCLPGNSKIKTQFGEKNICDIKQGELIATAVGKGYISYAPVSKIIKNKKKVRLVNLKTEGGHHLEVTDNHKLFSLIPAVDDGKYFYVYLMHRQGLGWRLGVTADLAVRLRLERSADKILGIKTCKTDEEARYYETLYSLKYNIPTVCFKEREGTVIKGEWLSKLYEEIDTEKNAARLANDLNIDLTSHHFLLGGVNRGEKLRIKISLEMCYRAYKSKYAISYFLQKPLVSHVLILETSDKLVIKKLQQAGYTLKKGRKNCYRLRIQDQDLSRLGKTALYIREITGGIIENSFKAGKTHIHTKKSLVMPAKNVLVGHYIPVLTKKGIIYDRVIKKTINDERNIAVYDLEVKPTHNFIANGVVVHNSIYKFRGASVANILAFKEHYPESQEVFLKENYRSTQNILDMAYNFIQLNNPDRLEWKLKDSKLSKKLIATTKDDGVIEYLECQDADDEARTVVKKIRELLKNGKIESLNDVAILVRSNDAASFFISALSDAELDYQFVAARGLFTKPVVMDVVSYLKLLDNYHESPALFRVLSSPYVNIPAEDIVTLTHLARRKSWSLFEAISSYHGKAVLSKKTKEALFKLTMLIAKHSELAKTRSPHALLIQILIDLGISKYLDEKPSYENYQKQWQLNQLFKEMASFSSRENGARLRDFMEYLVFLLESGEEGTLPSLGDEGPEAVTIMTIHSAKGLEFKYVFIPQLVDRRFPTIERRDAIEIPDALVRERLPEGDVHLEEERRLFYVACTRARRGLFFTSARDYGGVTAKKPSRFLYEIGLIKGELKKKSVTKLIIPPADTDDRKVGKKVGAWHPPLPKELSFSQFKAFETCPWQYRYAHLLKIPVKGRATFSFGHSMHSTLLAVFNLARIRERGGASLFDGPANKKKLKELVSWDDVIKLYEKNWQDDWFDSIGEKDEYKKEGITELKSFYDKEGEESNLPSALEENFRVKIGAWAVKGRIDRIDVFDNTVEIIDYKTGKTKEISKLTPDDKLQLMLYELALASNPSFKGKTFKLSYYFLATTTKVSFEADEKELKKTHGKLIALCEKIHASDFTATPSKHVCASCDYRDICPFRA